MRIAVICAWLVACATAPAPSPPPPEPAATPPATESKETVAPPETPPAEAAPPDERRVAQPPSGVADAEMVLKETIELMVEMANIMQSVVDDATAKAAAPRLQELTHQAEALKIRLDIIKDSVSAEQKEALKRKYEPQMTEVMNKLMQETKRVMQLPGVADTLRRTQKR